MIDVNGDYKGGVQEHCDDFWNMNTSQSELKGAPLESSSQPSFYKREVITLVNEGGEKNLLKAKRYINLLMQLEYEK